MNWREFYREARSTLPESEIDVGIRDLEKRSSIILNWIYEYGYANDSKILDCGCGIGIFCKILNENGFLNVLGIDMDESDLKCARKVCTVRKMDCRNLKFKGKTFDIILALNIIEHLSKPSKFLNNMRKIIKNNGVLILSLPNTTSLRKFFKKTITILEHVNYWSYKSFERFLNENRFKVLDMKPIGRFPFLLLCNTFMVLSKIKL